MRSLEKVSVSFLFALCGSKYHKYLYMSVFVFWGCVHALSAVGCMLKFHVSS